MNISESAILRLLSYLHNEFLIKNVVLVFTMREDSSRRLLGRRQLSQLAG